MGTVLKTQSGWRICAAGTRTKHKIKPIVFEVYTRDQACFRLFLSAWYRQHRNSYFDRVQQIPWNGVSQDLMRFWSYGSLFWTIIAGVLCSSELGFIFFLLLRNNAWQRNLKKRLLIDSFSSYVLLFGFYIQQNVNSAANFVFTSKIGLPRVVLVLRWVLFVRQIFVSPYLEFEQHIHSSDPRPDTVGEP